MNTSQVLGDPLRQCALALTLVVGPAHALDCWVPTIDQTQAAHRKLPLSALRSAVMAAEQMVRENPHFRAMPRPIRIRSQIAVGPGFGQLNVKAYRPEVWEGRCGLDKGADRGFSDGGINVMVNSPRTLLREYGRDDRVEVFYEPRRTSMVGGFPEYEGMHVLVTADGRAPWLPVTVAELLDFLERKQYAQVAEIRRLRDSLTPAQLAAQARHGNGPLNLGRDDDPQARPLVKLDPAFPDARDLNRPQIMTVFVSVVDGDEVAERRETMRRTKESLDYGRLATLLR